jgi:hypothetical protein
MSRRTAILTPGQRADTPPASLERRSNAPRPLRRLVSLCAGVALSAVSIPASALPGTFEVEQIYSNGAGTVQFVVIHDRGNNNCDSGEERWAGESLQSSGAGPTHLFVFRTNLSTCATSGKRILIGTQAFAALGIITPDYVIPNGFVKIPNGEVDFAGVNFVQYASLPSDGVTALRGDGTRIPNVATNFAGQSASVTGTSAFAINYGIGGTWYNPATSGQGIFIEIVPTLNLMVFSWFTWSHSATGDHDWLTGIGPIATDQAIVALQRSTGGRFNDPAPVASSSIGSATVKFTDCNNGTVAFTRSDIGTSGTIPITRLTTTPAACTAAGR